MLRRARMSMQFKPWFADSRVRDAQGEPLVVYHGTTVVRVVATPPVLGDQDALNKLKALAMMHGIAEYGDAPSVFERWLNMGMAASRGVTPEIARLARTWYEASKSRLTPPSWDLGFDRFELPAGQNELGAHFGTRGQASARGHVFPFYLAIRHPIRLPDLGTWGYQSVMREVRRRGVEITEEEYTQVFNATNNNAALRDLLMSKGVDGVVYRNEAEGHGDSYIALSPEQIRRAETPDQPMVAKRMDAREAEDEPPIDEVSRPGMMG